MNEHEYSLALSHAYQSSLVKNAKDVLSKYEYDLAHHEKEDWNIREQLVADSWFDNTKQPHKFIIIKLQ